MDNPSSESTGSLDLNQAASALSNLMEPIKDIDPNPPVDTEIDVKPPETEDKPEVEAEAPEEEDAGVTIQVDGKDVTLTKAELAEAYKNGLRQADYTKKTMEASELRKSAEQETAKARQERQAYAENLNRMSVQLEAVMQQQQQTDMNALLESDPVEYLKQQHLWQQRQAQLQQVNHQRQVIAEQQNAEQQQARQSFLQQQQQELLAKLPGWKDAAKAAAEREALRTYLKGEGYAEEDVGNIADHKAVILARKAMLYDQMISKASAAAKKVAPLPQKVERPGVNEAPSMDKRGAAYQRLSKSGSIQDAAALFSSIL